MLDGQYWNYARKSNFSNGNITLGFVPIPQKQDCWLLFHIGKIVQDLGIQNGVGYEYEELDEYKEYIGRIVVRFKNHSQNLIRIGENVLPECIVEEILPNVYNNDYFPLGRWETYIRTCHGGNKLLKELGTDYIKNNFYFTILETFNKDTDDQIIIDRESHWKDVLFTRKFGYNKN